MGIYERFLEEGPPRAGQGTCPVLHRFGLTRNPIRAINMRRISDTHRLPRRNPEFTTRRHIRLKRNLSDQLTELSESRESLPHETVIYQFG